MRRVTCDGLSQSLTFGVLGDHYVSFTTGAQRTPPTSGETMTFSLRTARIVAFAAAFFASIPASAGTFCADKADGLYAHPERCEQFISCAADGLIEATIAAMREDGMRNDSRCAYGRRLLL